MLGKNQLKRFFASSQNVYIVAAKRTPIGSFLGKLSSVSATQLSSITIKAALESKKIDPSLVDEVILGNVVASNLGQHPARIAALGAGLPIGTPVTNINKVCSSGMKSVMLGAQSIQLGQSSLVVTGGFESMSNIPFYVTGHRKGTPYGNSTLVDGIVQDGLTDVYNKCAMGICAEKTANDFQLSREVQDAYAITSYERAIASINSGKFADEIVPVKINDKETVTQDEEPLKFKKEKIPHLKPAFSKTGTVTAANSSKINDGAATIILASEAQVKALGLSPLGRIISYADSEVDPMDFCIAPAKSTQKALDIAGMKLSQIEYFEFNEAFAATSLCLMKLLDLDIQKINVNGGAVALGHPIGVSGARIIQSLLTVLKQNKGKYGAAGICNGGGGASSIIIENLQ